MIVEHSPPRERMLAIRSLDLRRLEYEACVRFCDAIEMSIEDEDRIPPSNSIASPTQITAFHRTDHRHRFHQISSATSSPFSTPLTALSSYTSQPHSLSNTTSFLDPASGTEPGGIISSFPTADARSIIRLCR